MNLIWASENNDFCLTGTKISMSEVLKTRIDVHITLTKTCNLKMKRLWIIIIFNLPTSIPKATKAVRTPTQNMTTHLPMDMRQRNLGLAHLSSSSFV